MKFYKCDTCGNIITFLENSGVPVSCCGKPMSELVPNTTDAATEKHVPVVETSGNQVNVVVGSTVHPMSDEHHISFIIVETNLGCHKIDLDPNGDPKATVKLVDNEEVVNVYEYCNLHGLWKA